MNLNCIKIYHSHTTRIHGILLMLWFSVLHAFQFSELPIHKINGTVIPNYPGQLGLIYSLEEAGEEGLYID